MKVNVIIQRGAPIQLYQVLHRYEQGTLKSSEPEVERLDPFLYTRMTRAVQWMQFDLLFWDYRHGDRTNITDREINIMENIYRGKAPGTFLTNGHGLETCHNYISGERADQPDPAQYSLVCGGNVLTGTEYRSQSGQLRLQVKTLTGAVDVHQINRQTHPELIQVATNCTTAKLPDGTYKVNPFEQRDGADVLAPILASVPVSIAMSELRKLPLGAPVPSPYNPPR